MSESVRVIRHHLSNALRVAAEQFDKDSAACNGPEEGMKRLAKQFQTQASECRIIADALDDGQSITIVES